MFSIAEKLEQLQYGESGSAVDFLDEETAELLPEDYVQFLKMFPQTGSFDIDVCAVGLEAAPCAPDKNYSISKLYALSEKQRDDLVALREQQSELPRHFLSIGADMGGNTFVLDLREQSAGRVYFWFHEQSIQQGMYLLEHSFTKFINSLTAE